MKVNRLVAEGFMAKLNWLIRTEEPIQAENDLMESCGIIPKDINQANELLMRWQNSSNNTRKWANCGYTPMELSERR